MGDATATVSLPLRGAERAVAREVLSNGPLSRTELARRLDLSAGSLTRLTRPLLDAGLLAEEAPVRDTRLGAPSRPLAVVPGARHALGVKLTGDAAHGVLVDLRADVLAHTTAPLVGHVPDDVVAVVRDVVATLRAEAPPSASIAGLGVTVGGLARARSWVADSPFLEWHDVPLGELVQAATGLPTTIENDLVALTETERLVGAGRGVDRFVLLTIGAGLGYGLVVHGRVISGPDDGISLLDHMPVADDGPVCPLGHHGCATAMLTTSAITQRAAAALGRSVGYDELLRLARTGYADARAVTDEAGRALGRLVGLVANVTSPERVVLSGEGIHLAHVAQQALDEGIAGVRHPAAAPLTLVVERADFTEWARGAAVIAIEEFVLGRD